MTHILHLAWRQPFLDPFIFRKLATFSILYRRWLLALRRTLSTQKCSTLLHSINRSHQNGSIRTSYAKDGPSRFAAHLLLGEILNKVSSSLEYAGRPGQDTSKLSFLSGWPPFM